MQAAEARFASTIFPISQLVVAFFHDFKQQVAAVPLNARFSATLPIHPIHSLTHP
jgi:hypothetical protein